MHCIISGSNIHGLGLGKQEQNWKLGEPWFCIVTWLNYGKRGYAVVFVFREHLSFDASERASLPGVGGMSPFISQTAPLTFYLCVT